MKTGLLALLLVLAGTGAAFADSCAINTYDNYVGPPSISCTITVNPPGDDKTFSNFSYSTSGTDHMPASQITVTPESFPYVAGLMFNAPWSAGVGRTQDSLIGFTVATSGSALINDLTLTMIGAGFTGTGSASVAETYCLGDTFANGCAKGTTGTLFVFKNGLGTNLTDTVTFKGVKEVDVMKDVLLSGGTDGTAMLSGVENEFSQPLPEPGSLSVLGGGLITMGVLLRRKLGV